MRKALTIVFCCIAAGSMAQSLRRTPVVGVVEKVRPAVVNLTARQVVAVHRRSIFDDLFPEFAPPGGEIYSQSLGSGVVISPDGIILTNEHVIEGAAAIKVKFANGKEQDAEVVGSDADADLAVLRVQGKGLPNLPAAEQDDLMIGETVIAIGNPLGLENTVTVGVLSAQDRTVTSPNTRRVYTDFLQIDASINPGNSGGALVDLDGRLIGINTAIIGDAQGIGFAIPAKRVRRVVNDLLRYGQVQPAWIGVFVKNRGEGRRGRMAGPGIEIVEVLQGSPAANAGLTRGQVLFGGNGRPFSSRDDYATVIAQLTPGDKVTLQLAEGRGSRDVSLRSTRPPDDLGERVFSRFVGIKVINRGGKVLVSRIIKDSPAEQVGLDVGDVVLAINGERTEKIEDINRIVARDHTRSSILLVIGRGMYSYQLPFPLSS